MKTVVTDLDDELLCYTFHLLDAHDMARVVCARSGWGVLVIRVAEELLRQRRQLRPGHGECPCWLRSLATLQMLEGAVGPMPTTRTWRDEYPSLRADVGRRNNELHGDVEWLFTEEEDYVPGAIAAIDSFLEERNDAILAKVDSGWTIAEAEAREGINCADLALTPSLRERDGRYAATLHTSVALASELARRGGDPAAPHMLYCAMDGTDGLVEGDAAWAAEELLARGIGGSFTSMCAVECMSDEIFRTAAGIHFYDGELAAWQVWDSAVLAIRCSPPNAEGYHTPIFNPIASDRQRRTRAHRAQNPNEWWAPPLTRVTTEAVHEPGEWQVRGLHVQQRVFVVSISFG